MSVRSLAMQSTYEEEESGQEDDSGIASEEMLSMDEEDSQDASDSFIEAEPSSSKPACGYRVLDDAGVSALQVECVERLTTLLGCPASHAKSILIVNRWDVDRVVSMLADKGIEEVYKTAGFTPPKGTSSSQGQPGCSGAGSGPATCGVCCDTVPQSALIAAGSCGHTFCKECWRQHFITGIKEGQACRLRCMEYKCGAPVDDSAVVEVLAGPGDHEVLAKYKHRMVQSFIEDNSSARFCPSVPYCGHSILVEGGDTICEPECVCGHVFCFKCCRAPHTPCSCDMWEKWEEKTSGDSETRHWITANTKPCPKCNKLVEKNGGCNHVTCKCGQYFCWLCGQATGLQHTYRNIENHTCGRYKEEMEARQSKAAAAHKRYMFYFERWNAHVDSHKREQQKRSELLDRIQQSVATGVDSRDFGWLMQALDQLKTARSILAPSYVFAYFFFGQEMFRDNFSEEENTRNQNLFEDQQQQLEMEIERLSQLTGSCSESLTLDEKERVKVINSSVNIQERIIKLFATINELLDQLQTCSVHIAMYQPRKRVLV